MTKMTDILDILVVESNPMHQRTIDDLKENGHQVDLVTDYVTAIKKLGIEYGHVMGETLHPGTRKKYDAVLTSLMLQYGTDYKDHEYSLYNDLPIGLSVALTALRVGVPYIGVLYDNRPGSHESTAEYAISSSLNHSFQVADMFWAFPARVEAGESTLAMMRITDFIGKRHILPDGTLLRRPSDVPFCREPYSSAENMKDWKTLLDYLRKERKDNPKRIEVTIYTKTES